MKLSKIVMLILGLILIVLAAELWRTRSEKLQFVQEAPNCDDTTSRLVAHAYLLSIPLMGREPELIFFMRSNPGYFNEGGRAIRCMQSLGNALVQSGRKVSNKFAGSEATATWGGNMPAGLENLPGQVDRELNSYGSETTSMGQELLWLSKVLPPAAQGDYAPYNTTGTDARQQMRATLPLFLTLCQMDPGNCRGVQAMSPALENVVYTLARQSGK